jgi:hypothetical protein
MNRRGQFLLTCVAGTIVVAPTSFQAHAADQTMVVKAGPKVAEAIPFWWFHGELDVGGRFFVNNPQRDGLNFLRQDSLAKYVFEHLAVHGEPGWPLPDRSRWQEHRL